MPTDALDRLRTNKRGLPTWIAYLVSGSLAEVAQMLIGYPANTIKVICQHTGQPTLQAIRTLLATYPGVNILPVLFAGGGPSALFALMTGAVYYMAFKQTTAHFRRMFGHPPVSREGDLEDVRPAILSAVSASVITGLIEGPIETVRNRVQTGVVQQDMLRYMFRHGGLAASLPFVVPFLMKVLPYDVTELLTYSLCGDYITSHRALLHVSQEVQDAVVGGVAGTAAVLASAPFDCIKTRIVTLSPEIIASSAQSPGVGKLWMVTVRHILRTRGVPGLFVGTAARLCEVVPGTMLYWVTAEAVTRALKPYMRDCIDGSDCNSP